MNSIILFFTCQKLFLTLLVGLTVIPFYLSCVYLPEIPLTQYIFLIIIGFIKIIVFNEKALEKQLTPMAREHLKKQMGKNPSNQQTFNQVKFYIMARNISLLGSILAIVIIGIIYQRF